MPTYCYRRGRKVVQRVFRVNERPEEISIGGKVYRHDRAYEFCSIGVPASSGWPLTCMASGVNPEQAGELRKFYADHGVPTEVTKDGNPVYRNAAHRKKALKARGLHDNSSFY
jgi:hypothetical protein